MQAPVQSSNAAPERSLDQRMEALRRANDIRSKRAQLKRDLKGQKVKIQTLLMDPPEYVQTAKVIDKDGWPVPAPWKCDTLNVAPGERYDVIVNCTNPGTWAFHCHILPHAESDHGMFGMVTALVVQR